MALSDRCSSPLAALGGRCVCVVVQRPFSSSGTGKLDPLGSWSRDLAGPWYGHIGSHTAGCSLFFGIFLCCKNLHLKTINNRKAPSWLIKAGVVQLVKNLKGLKLREEKKNMPKSGGKVAQASLSLGQCHFLLYSMSQAISLFPSSWKIISILGKPVLFNCVVLSQRADTPCNDSDGPCAVATLECTLSRSQDLL